MQNLNQYRNKLDAWDNNEIKPKAISQKEIENRGLEQFLKGDNGAEVRAMLAGSGNGALTVPTHIHDEIIGKAFEVAPIFARTRIITPENGHQEVLREVSIGKAAFIGEGIDLVPEDFVVDKVRLEAKRVGTAMELSEEIIEDSGVNMAAEAKKILGRRYGMTIENSILFGQKATQFEGILVDSAENTIKQTTLASLKDLNSPEKLMALYQSVNDEYHDKACWIFSRKLYNHITKLQAANGQYYLMPDPAKKLPPYLFGFPVFIHEDLDNPTLNPNNKLVVFGNFNEGYVTMNKRGARLRHVTGDTTQALRGSQLFVLDGRMDGKILQPDALAIMKFTTV